jgi:hypothetical protein
MDLIRLIRESFWALGEQSVEQIYLDEAEIDGDIMSVRASGRRVSETDRILVSFRIVDLDSGSCATSFRLGP